MLGSRAWPEGGVMNIDRKGRLMKYTSDASVRGGKGQRLINK